MANGTAESIDAIVTDPPYGLGFMGKQWDALPPGEEWARECLRVLKPGGHLLAFGGTRTYHRLAAALEDAGFEIRDCIAWMYGTGFPKSLDVSKAIDKAAGAEREVVKTTPSGGYKRLMVHNKDEGFRPDDYYPEGNKFTSTVPVTPAAEQWQGWGTALKPAFEPIVVARKPLSEKTVAANVQKWGTGALNIDGTRIATDDVLSFGSREIGDGVKYGTIAKERQTPGEQNSQGRWPANVTLDAEAAAMLDEQSVPPPTPDIGPERHRTGAVAVSNGGASRFFYVAKASRRERGEGNDHPTVKPIELMRWLVRLVTPPDGRVLDPFMGSGTTGLATLAEGFSFIGIELDPHYYEIATTRLATLSEEVA